MNYLLHEDDRIAAVKLVDNALQTLKEDGTYAALQVELQMALNGLSFEDTRAPEIGSTVPGHPNFVEEHNHHTVDCPRSVGAPCGCTCNKPNEYDAFQNSVNYNHNVDCPRSLGKPAACICAELAQEVVEDE